MFVKKIVDWISLNQQLDPLENINEILNEEPKKQFSKSIEDVNSNDISSDSSSGAVTSVLDFSSEQNNDYNNLPNSREEDNNEVANCSNQAKLIVFPEKKSKNTQTELKNKKSEGNNLKSKDISPNKNFSSNFSVPDNRTCVDDDKRGGLDNKLNELSENIPELPPFCKKIPDFNRHTAPDVKHLRNIFTQTEAKSEKPYPDTVTKYSYKHNVSHDLDREKKIRTFPASGLSSAFNPWSEKSGESLGTTVYGVLYVFGCNKTVPAHLADKMNTKYIFRRRFKPNGVTEAFSYVKPNNELLSVSPAKHVITYPLSNNSSVVVAYKHDPLTDMFQIGRHEKYPVDFKVDDTNSLDKARHGVSRYACRILIRRDGAHEAALYAAAFDSSGAIFLGESGVACNYRGKMDGFTTNGVLILQPKGDYPGKWREVSVSGYIYPLRSSKVDISKRSRLAEESNVLKDGTLIDLCGVTLIWRTPDGLRETPNEEYLIRLQSTLHKSVPECQLLFRDSSLLAPKGHLAVKKAYVYLACGHVIGLALSRLPENDGKGWSCPVCRAIGPITELTIGAERGFYLDREFPSYAFKPCGHVASKKTVRYWSAVEIPNHRNIQGSYCPFCGMKLNFITKNVKLTLPVL